MRPSNAGSAFVPLGNAQVFHASPETRTEPYPRVVEQLGSLDVPETEDELRLLLAGGRLGERNAIDLKRELGTSGKANVELARDLASLAAQGGLLIVSVDEGPPGSLAPSPLAGLKERIANVARDGVRPALRIDVREMASRSSVTYRRLRRGDRSRQPGSAA